MYAVARDMSINNVRICTNFSLQIYVLDSGGDIEVVVASDKDVKISPVRQAFQAVFGKATVT